MYIRGFASTTFPDSGKGRADRKNQAVNLRKKEGPTVQRKKSFLVVCLSILMVIARGQAVLLSPVEKIVPTHLTLTKMSLLSGLTAAGPAMAGVQLLPAGITKPIAAFPPFRVQDQEAFDRAAEAAYIGGGAYYVDHLGFFCKRELDIQKTTHLPVFFRLGSLESCNKLEGK
jgi:hypothetical protein